MNFGDTPSKTNGIRPACRDENPVAVFNRFCAASGNFEKGITMTIEEAKTQLEELTTQADEIWEQLKELEHERDRVIEEHINKVQPIKNLWFELYSECNDIRTFIKYFDQ